jgi:hypothetical protein
MCVGEHANARLTMSLSHKDSINEIDSERKLTPYLRHDTMAPPFTVGDTSIQHDVDNIEFVMAIQPADDPSTERAIAIT